MIEDKGIERVRQARKKISMEFNNDLHALVKHYKERQEKYKDRLVSQIANQRTVK